MGRGQLQRRGGALVVSGGGGGRRLLGVAEVVRRPKLGKEAKQQMQGLHAVLRLGIDGNVQQCCSGQ